MTRGQMLDKIKKEGYEITTININGITYCAEKGGLKFIANTPAALWKQIKLYKEIGR